jgi:hypothetical protein
MEKTKIRVRRRRRRRGVIHENGSGGGGGDDGDDVNSDRDGDGGGDGDDDYESVEVLLPCRRIRIHTLRATVAADCDALYAAARPEIGRQLELSCFV